MNILLPKVEHILWNLVSMSIKEKNLDFKNTRKKKSITKGKKKKEFSIFTDISSLCETRGVGKINSKQV